MTYLMMMGIVTTLTVRMRQAIISTTLETDSPPATFMNKDRKSIALSTACDSQNGQNATKQSIKIGRGVLSAKKVGNLTPPNCRY